MQTSMFRKFTIKLKSDLLLELLQRLAARAYERGRDDALSGKTQEEPNERVKIDPNHLRRFM